jgi:hypothetical protein
VRKPVSNFAFQIHNLQRYVALGRKKDDNAGAAKTSAAAAAGWGSARWNQVDP